MLQIRLNKGAGSGDGAGAGIGAAPRLPAAPGEAVTVACPDHLVIADLPVAKSLGSVPSSAISTPRSIGRRTRRPIGDRVHICFSCDFPIAIYGRLSPCEHVFCLTCARSNASCCICEERIQKIQSIKMLEGIFICSAPQCLKSFLKRSDFDSHVHEVHGNLLQVNGDKDGVSMLEAPAVSRQLMVDAQKHPLLPESTPSRAAPSRPVFSPTSSSQQDREDSRSAYHGLRDQPPLPRVPRPTDFQGRQLTNPGDQLMETGPPHPGFDRQHNWFPPNPRFDVPQDRQSVVPPSPLIYPPLPSQPHPPNFAMNINQSIALNPAFFPPMPQEGAPQFFAAPLHMQMPDAASEQASLLGLPPPPRPLNFPDGIPQPWGMPFPAMQVGQGADGSVSLGDGPRGLAFMQASFSGMPEGLPLVLNLPGGMDLKDLGFAPQMPLQGPSGMTLPPPPPMPHTSMQMFQ